MRALVAACTVTVAEAVTLAAPQPSGWFRGALHREDGVEIPFQLFLATDGQQSFIRNGDDLPVLVSWVADRLRIEFPHFDSNLELRPMDAGSLVGEWTRTGRTGARMQMKATARSQAGFSPGIEFGPAEAGDWNDAPSTEKMRWRMMFSESGQAIGVLTPPRSLKGNPAARSRWLRGTIETPTGDYRFLSGGWGVSEVPPADVFCMSVFDGAHAFVFKGAMQGDRIEGDWYSGPTHHETFTATRLRDGETFELPNPFSETSLKPGETRLALPILNQPPYLGAPTIVQVFGSWCPNCHDEAPVLKELHDRYAKEGLQILGLAYEHMGKDADPATDERAKRQIERFTQKYGIPWRIEVAGSSDKQQAAATLPALSAIKAFPTTIFLNRDGTVRAIHSGFAGPATGEEHETLKAEFDRLAREIVASGPEPRPE